MMKLLMGTDGRDVGYVISSDGDKNPYFATGDLSLVVEMTGM